MNYVSKNIGNFLFVAKDKNYAHDFHELCLECAKRNYTVLLITRKPLYLLPLLNKLNIAVEQLKKFIIMYFDCIQGVAKKLMELDDWTLIPVLVVIDLNAFLEEYQGAYNGLGASQLALAPATVPALKKIALCIATLFYYMKSVERRLLASSQSGQKSEAELFRAHSVVLLGEHADHLTQVQVELLINMYYYNASAFDDYNELKCRITATWG